MQEFKKKFIQDEPILKGRSNVVLLLIKDDDLFLIKRSATMPSHKNQIAMIGGGIKKKESILEAAEREFEEETSLDSSSIEFMGYLPSVYAAKDRLIYPCIYKINDLTQIKSNGEWDEAFLMPVKNLLQEDTWEHAFRYGRETNNSVLFRLLKSEEVSMVEGNAKDYVLWGATARIVWNFLSALNQK